MITHTVKLTVPSAKAEQFYNHMLTQTTEQYRQWWPEEHIQFSITKHGDESHLGDEVLFDEYLGENIRLVFRAVVTEVNFPNRIVWQMKKAGVRLPAYLYLEFENSQDGLLITHTLKVGFTNIGKIFDPFIRIYLNKAFQDALEKHCRIEFPKLAEYLSVSQT